MSKKLTDTQKQLLMVLQNSTMSYTVPLSYDAIKKHSNFKSFDSSFNALLLKGAVSRVDANDDKFVLTF